MSEINPDFYPWQAYYSPHVRNLAWVLSSPALLTYLPNFHQPLIVLDDVFWQQHYQAYVPKLQALDLDPQPLTDFLTQHKNHRLGYYFEYLLLFWLQDKDFHSFELIKHRATLFEGKTTIGELDFLIKNQTTGKIEHWEVAIKFYLGHPPLNDALCWLGANDNDSFGRKLEHLAQKQFRYACYQDYEIEQRCLVVKGRLFYPSSDKKLLKVAEGATLDCLSAQHLQSNWWRWDEFVQSQEAAQLTWRHVGRDEWLADQQINKCLPLMTVAELPSLATTRAELFIGFNEDGQEQARCFVRP
jgi:uncharacterized protein